MGWFLVFGVVAIAAVVVASIRARSGSARQRALLQRCADAGLACSVLDPFPDTTLLPFRVFGCGGAHGVENVVWDGEPGKHAIGCSTCGSSRNPTSRDER